MGQFLGFGNGSDGAGALSGTDAPNDSTFSGTAGATTGTGKTGMTVAAGALALIIQMRGTGAGAWELKQVVGYDSGTGVFTFAGVLDNTYTDSGASQAQIIILKQYSGVTVASTFTGKAWDGNVGGVISFLCNGTVDITNTITGAGKGFRGGAGGFGTGNANTVAHWATQGEGTSGDGTATNTRNGTGGGGAHNNRGPVEAGTSAGQGGSGGGGANGSDGANGGHATPEGGLAGGTADLITMLMGGGGGGGGSDYPSGNNGGVGGNGGGIVLIFARRFVVSGSVIVDGAGGGAPSGANANSGGAGGGGGSILIYASEVSIGSNLMTALGGAGANGTLDHNGQYAPNGAVGRIRLEICASGGTTNPTASESVGGKSFCSVSHAIL